MPGLITRSAIYRKASAWIFTRRFPAALLCFIAVPALSNAQVAPGGGAGGDRYFAPQKDVAVLVDVSISVESNPNTKARDDDAIRDAKKIVKDLISGRGFKGGGSYSKRDWEVKPGQDPSLSALFAHYVADANAGPQSAELTALAKPGGNLLILPVGNLTTVLNRGTTTTIKSIQPGQLDSLIDQGYPTSMRDTSTCFWFAMARAAETLTEQSRDGYYLFVVSDEEDDPDYRKEGPPGHTAKDYDNYRSKLAGIWPEGTIRSTIERYFINRTVERSVEQYTPRTGFAKTLIAKFYRRDAPLRNNPVSISWYAMGVVPTIIHEKPKPPPEIPPVSVATFVAPKFTPRLQFLGGLGEHAKKFDYDEPLVAWQVIHGSPSDLNELDAGARLTAEGAGRTQALVQKLPNAGRKNFPRTIQLSSLKSAEYQMKLQLGTASQGAERLSIEAPIKYEPRTDFWLMVLAITSLVAAVGIFFFAWRNLRETRVVPLS